MLVTSLRSVIEQSISDPGVKHLAGNVTKPDLLFSDEAIERLEHAHASSFAFLAFHPKGDSAIVTYLDEGTLPDDSGAIMCLFTMRSSGMVDDVAPASLADFVAIESGRSPASIVLGSLFDPEPRPPLPGIVFFRHFSSPRPIYVPLANAGSAADVRRSLRELFAIAESIQLSDEGDDGFSSKFGFELQRRRIAYISPGCRSMRESLLRCAQTLWDHRQDIFTIVKLVSP